jgi:hypothetical protein
MMAAAMSELEVWLRLLGAGAPASDSAPDAGRESYLAYASRTTLEGMLRVNASELARLSPLTLGVVAVTRCSEVVARWVLSRHSELRYLRTPSHGCTLYHYALGHCARTNMLALMEEARVETAERNATSGETCRYQGVHRARRVYNDEDNEL